MIEQRNATTSVEPKPTLDSGAASPVKAPYAPPQVTVYGTIAELTNGSAGALNDLPGTRAA
jgi:hypothetical protein